MHYSEDAEYRRRLASGFLNEAHLNYQYQLWRSCVDNAQLSIENSGKMIVALVEPVEKTHNPAHQLQRLAGQKRLDDSFLPQVLRPFGADIFGIYRSVGTLTYNSKLNLLRLTPNVLRLKVSISFILESFSLSLKLDNS